MKFGGTSVGNAEALRQSTAIVKRYLPEWDRIVVVVSAMSGVTDMLLKSAQSAASGDERTYQETIAELRSRQAGEIAALFYKSSRHAQLQATIDKYIEDLNAFCHSVYIIGEVTSRGLDMIASLGERMNARIFSALLNEYEVKSSAVDATELIVTDNTFQDAVPLMAETREKVKKNLVPLLEKGATPVVTGFIGATREGITTTLGRGGSDYTASILGDCLDAAEVWTWTDVDGVMTADPRVVPDALVIPELSFNEVGELAYFGAKVLHPKTIRPIIERSIPLWVKNTFNPDFPGTRISQERTSIPGKVTAVTTIKQLSLVTVEGRGMLGVPGIAARTFAAVARVGASVLMISQASSEQSICFLIPMQAVGRVIQSLEQEMALELSRCDIDRIWAQDDVVIVTVIGAGLRQTPGVSALVFGALGKAGINVIAIAQGSSEYSISLVVESGNADEAVRQIHREAILNGG